MKSTKKLKEYIDRKVKFLSRNFYIDERAHIPRPSTEFITKSYIKSINDLVSPNLVVADIGTGSGVLPVSTALECSNIRKIYAIDLFEDALKVAKINRSKYGLANKIAFVKGDLFKPLLEKPVDVILANLPFADAAKMQKLRPEVIKYEPISGIYGGKTGFELYDKLFRQLDKYQYFNRIRIIWIYCNIEHKQRVEYLHKSLLRDFKLKFVKDKYKPYYLHCYFYRC